MKKKRIIYLDIFRVIALLLILNFHLDIVYPERLKVLAFGGDIGNNLFFFLFGYLAINSLEGKAWREFIPIFWGKILKLVPVHLAFLMIPYIFPGIIAVSYWFVPAIIVFYLLDYVILRFLRNLMPAFVSLLVVLHYIYDTDFAERYIMGLIAVIMGGLANKYVSGRNKKDYMMGHVMKWSGLIASFILFAVCKRLYVPYSHKPLLHIMIGMTSISFACFMILVFDLYASRIDSFFENRHVIYKLLLLTSSSTVYMYLIQIFDCKKIIYVIHKYFAFPVSYICAIMVIVILGIFLMKIDSGIRVLLKKVISIIKKG